MLIFRYYDERMSFFDETSSKTETRMDGSGGDKVNFHLAL